MNCVSLDAIIRVIIIIIDLIIITCKYYVEQRGIYCEVKWDVVCFMWRTYQCLCAYDNGCIEQGRHGMKEIILFAYHSKTCTIIIKVICFNRPNYISVLFLSGYGEKSFIRLQFGYKLGWCNVFKLFFSHIVHTFGRNYGEDLVFQKSPLAVPKSSIWPPFYRSVSSGTCAVNMTELWLLRIISYGGKRWPSKK